MRCRPLLLVSITSLLLATSAAANPVEPASAAAAKFSIKEELNGVTAQFQIPRGMTLVLFEVGAGAQVPGAEPVPAVVRWGFHLPESFPLSSIWLIHTQSRVEKDNGTFTSAYEVSRHFGEIEGEPVKVLCNPPAGAVTHAPYPPTRFKAMVRNGRRMEAQPGTPHALVHIQTQEPAGVDAVAGAAPQNPERTLYALFVDHADLQATVEALNLELPRSIDKYVKTFTWQVQPRTPPQRDLQLGAEPKD